MAKVTLDVPKSDDAGSIKLCTRIKTATAGNATFIRRWLRAAWLLTVLTFGFRAVAGCYPPPSGIIGFWEGDGNALDVVGGNNGVLVSNATATATGEVNSAFSFDGVRSYVQIADSAVLHPTNFTIEAWVNFTSLSSTTSGGAPAGEQYIVFKQNTRTTNFEGFALVKQVNLRFAPRLPFHGYWRRRPAGGPQWIPALSFRRMSGEYVAAVRQSNEFNFISTARFKGRRTSRFPRDYGAHSLYFGTTGQTYDGKFSGRLDEVSLYNVPLGFNDIAGIWRVRRQREMPATDQRRVCQRHRHCRRLQHRLGQ